MSYGPDYEGTPRVSYAGGACFLRVCPQCGRFVAADGSIAVNVEGGLVSGPTGTCVVHKRIEMPFEGFIGDPGGSPAWP